MYFSACTVHISIMNKKKKHAVPFHAPIDTKATILYLLEFYLGCCNHRRLILAALSFYYSVSIKAVKHSFAGD
jgi:hypothetical protein